jgi:hypothetical protein
MRRGCNRGGVRGCQETCCEVPSVHWVSQPHTSYSAAFGLRLLLFLLNLKYAVHVMTSSLLLFCPSSHCMQVVRDVAESS